MISKEKVRRRALEARDSLEQAWRGENSRIIIKKVLGSEIYQRAKIVLSYSAFRSEVETEELNRDILKCGKKLYLPKTYPEEKKMCFYQVEDLTELKRGYQGIFEPEEKNPVEFLMEDGDSGLTKQDILMVMPGLTFDENRNRMGYGGGYYDRYLQLYGDKVTSMFIAFYEQKAIVIPAEKCDVKPDYIVTQKD